MFKKLDEIKAMDLSWIAEFLVQESNFDGDKLRECWDFLLETIEKQEEELQIYAEAIGDIEYAMEKVGWNNSRVESAFEEMNKKLNLIKE